MLVCMNDMAALCEHKIDRVASLAGTGVGSLNRNLRRNMKSARE